MVFFVFYVVCSWVSVVCAKAHCVSAGLTLSAKALVVGYSTFPVLNSLSRKANT